MATFADKLRMLARDGVQRFEGFAYFARRATGQLQRPSTCGSCCCTSALLRHTAESFNTVSLTGQHKVLY